MGKHQPTISHLTPPALNESPLTSPNFKSSKVKSFQLRQTERTQSGGVIPLSLINILLYYYNQSLTAAIGSMASPTFTLLRGKVEAGGGRCISDLETLQEAQ